VHLACAAWQPGVEVADLVAMGPGVSLARARFDPLQLDDDAAADAE